MCGEVVPCDGVAIWSDDQVDVPPAPYESGLAWGEVRERILLVRGRSPRRNSAHEPVQLVEGLPVAAGERGRRPDSPESRVVRVDSEMRRSGRGGDTEWGEREKGQDEGEDGERELIFHRERIVEFGIW